MQVTAIIQNDTLIIPNLDLSQLKPLADRYGLVKLDLSMLDSLFNQEPAVKKTLSIREMGGGLANKTDIKATIEEMNASIAQAYKHWEV